MSDYIPHSPGESADVEYPYKDHEKLIRYYSALGYTVIQNETGNEYGEAIDPYPSKYMYTISENKIEPDDNPIEPEEEA